MRMTLLASAALVATLTCASARAMPFVANDEPPASALVAGPGSTLTVTGFSPDFVSAFALRDVDTLDLSLVFLSDLTLTSPSAFDFRLFASNDFADPSVTVTGYATFYSRSGTALFTSAPATMSNDGFLEIAGGGGSFWSGSQQVGWIELYTTALSNFSDGVDIGVLNYDAYSLTLNGYSAPAPEPATWAVMLAGFGLAGAAIRRRRALA